VAAFLKRVWLGKKEQLGLLGIPDNAFASGDARRLALATTASAIPKRGAKTLKGTISNQRR
jgi:hypothetical protein